MVVQEGGTYYMFAEGQDDHAQLLTSPDKIHWTWQGFLDIRTADGKPISKGPYGTPTAWFENGIWHLFYERGDRAVWLAESKDLKVFTNVRDEPVLVPGPGEYDRQISRSTRSSSTTAVITPATTARLAVRVLYPGQATWRPHGDLIHWQKYAGNPLRPLAENKSSNLLIKTDPTAKSFACTRCTTPCGLIYRRAHKPRVAGDRRRMVCVGKFARDIVPGVAPLSCGLPRRPQQADRSTVSESAMSNVRNESVCLPRTRTIGIAAPILVTAVGVGWLLTVQKIIPGVEWAWVLLWPRWGRRPVP